MTDRPGTVAEATADWWVAMVTDTPLTSIGDDGQGGMGWVILAYAQLTQISRSPLVDEHTETFRGNVQRRVEQYLERFGADAMGLCLDVDYGPGYELSLDAEGLVSPSRFPRKTRTWSYHDKLLASIGYGGRTHLVWAVPGFERPLCHDQGYEVLDGGEGRHLAKRCTLPRWHLEEHGEWELYPLCAECGSPEKWPTHNLDDGRGHAYRAA